jgi:TRAP-type mannitol/chloroaromatic compound transport system permease small subunit
MNTEAQDKAHECAERAAYYEGSFRKQMWLEILGAVLFIPFGLITLPLGAIFLIIGGGCIVMAFVSHTVAKQAHKEFFELRDGYLKEEQQ